MTPQQHFGYPDKPCLDCVDDACTMNCAVPKHLGRSGSYPFMQAAKLYGVPYGEVLRAADLMETMPSGSEIWLLLPYAVRDAVYLANTQEARRRYQENRQRSALETIQQSPR